MIDVYAFVIVCMYISLKLVEVANFDIKLIHILMTEIVQTLLFLSSSHIITYNIYSYQSLKSEVRYQQSPNTEKDLENPL